MSKRILDLQTRFTEAGRIRLGERRGNRPTKIDKLRFTSPSHDLIAQISELYGGTPSRWESPRGMEWQVYIDQEEIDIIVPPSDEALTTSYEIWSAAGMRLYCDGDTMKRPGSDEERPCQCAQDIREGRERECKIKARMIVWLPKIQTLGVWRLETGSWYAAGELTRMVDTLLQASNQLQRAVSAKLRLDKRVVKRDGQTFNFNVPIITPVGDVAVVLEAATPMSSLPKARNVDMRPDAPAALPAPETTEWPSDEPSNLEGYEHTERYQRNDQGDLIDMDSFGDTVEIKNETVEHNEAISSKEHKFLMVALNAINYTDTERHDLVRHVTGDRTESSKELMSGDMPEIWKRVTTRATIEVQKYFGLLWREPAIGWETLKKIDGLSSNVKDWKLNEWLIALDYCENAYAKMTESSESQVT